jgi:PPOX class probable FMN-dependent enzyme
MLAILRQEAPPRGAEIARCLEDNLERDVRHSGILRIPETAMRFSDVVTDPVQLRDFIGEPPPPCVAKTITRLDIHCKSFIARSPFVLIASSNARGEMDISPKGDAPGFVRVLDDHTLAIPDRPGNRRADTFTNVLQNSKIGLLFLIPGKTETLRISGTAAIVRDVELRESMAARGKVPDFALGLHVEEAFFHCSKCIIRSSLWTPETWPALDGLPNLARTMIDAAALPMPIEALEEIIRQDEVERLY